MLNNKTKKREREGKGIRMGFNDWLIKMNREELLDTLKKYIG